MTENNAYAIFPGTALHSSPGEEEATGPQPTNVSTNATIGSEDPANAFANALASALRAVLRETGIPGKREICSFSGLPHEDPEEFLQRLDQYFINHHIIDDDEKLRLTIQQFKAGAARWYSQIAFYHPNYHQLKEMVLTQYDSEEARTQARVQLFVDKQLPHEPADLFILKKRRLFHRVDPNLPVPSQISILMEQLRPELKPLLRLCYFPDLEALAKTAVGLEKDMNLLQPKPQGAANNQRAAPRANNPPTPSQNNRQGSNTNNQTIENRQTATNIQTTNQTTRASPPYPCRFCLGPHYNNQCPQNPRNRQSGNGQREGSATGPARPATNAAQTPQ